MILLDTPISLGDAGANPYTHVRIHNLNVTHDDKSLRLKLRAGHLDEDDVFVPGRHVTDITYWSLHLTDDVYMALLGGALTSAAGVLIYKEQSNALYQHVLDTEVLVGSLV